MPAPLQNVRSPIISVSGHGNVLLDVALAVFVCDTVFDLLKQSLTRTALGHLICARAARRR